MRYLLAVGISSLLAGVAACSGSDNDVASGTDGAGTGTAQDGGNGSGDSGGNGTAGGGSSTGGGTASSNSGGTGGSGTGSTGGTAGTGTSTGGDTNGGTAGGASGGEDCRNVQCLRAYECVPECGSDQVTNNGCCPCPEGTVDLLTCPSDTIPQGISGSVLWLEGNHMPGPGAPGGTTMPVSREVRVYEAVSSSDAVAATDRPDAYGVYTQINGTLAGSTTSGEDGSYEIELSAGTYSVFVEDEGDWYCNGIGAEGLCAVTVPDGEVVEYDVRIDYAAAY